MFSRDERAIRIAELKAEGTRGDVQRLRQSCTEAAAIFMRTATVLEGGRARKLDRLNLATDLRRGAIALRKIVWATKPKRSK